jgi:hypothetical protein
MKFGIVISTFAAVSLILSAPAFARGQAGGSNYILIKGGSGGSHSVRGYTRRDGTYVAPHQQTNPNSTKRDNWSTKGNVNPYTGKEGTKVTDK